MALRGQLRIDYGDAREPDQPITWMWKFIDGARTAGELYGRALVVIAAEQYAARLVVPQSQRSHPTCWSFHKDHAYKALKKLTGPHLPASLKQLQAAVAKVHREHANAERAAHTDAAERPVGVNQVGVDADLSYDELGEQLDEIKEARTDPGL